MMQRTIAKGILKEDPRVSNSSKRTAEISRHDSLRSAPAEIRGSTTDELSLTYTHSCDLRCQIVWTSYVHTSRFIPHSRIHAVTDCESINISKATRSFHPRIIELSFKEIFSRFWFQFGWFNFKIITWKEMSSWEEFSLRKFFSRALACYGASRVSETQDETIFVSVFSSYLRDTKKLLWTSCVSRKEFRRCLIKRR